MVDGNQFNINCNQYPPEDLARYAENYVAWSTDGKAILGHAAELEDLDREMKKRGIEEYVSEWIFPPDQHFLGSAGL
jgi:hypothetical protein